MTFTEYGKAARDAAGWHVCLERLAARATATARDTPPGPDRWKECPRTYGERFGPEASAIGPPSRGPTTHRPGS